MVALVDTELGDVKVIVGNTFTVPLTATFCVVAPVAEQVTLPEGEPADAEDFTRT